MSDLFYSEFVVIHESCLTNYFSEEVSELLSGERIPRNQYVDSRTYRNDRMNSIVRRMSIATRNDWLHARLKELLRESGIEGLRFLSGETCTHRRKEATKYEGKIVCEQTFEYTVLSPDYDKVISSIDQLYRWCLLHPEAAAKLLDVCPKDLTGSIESAFFTLNTSDDGFDSGEGADFAFCVLKTIGDLMRYAKYNKRTVIFSRELYPEFPSS